MKMQNLRDRSKAFALRVIRMYAALPKDTIAQVLGKQALRAGASVAANFREATRSRSDKEFLAKMGIDEGELDETMLWLELLFEGGIVKERLLKPLHAEAEELLKIVVASIRTVKRKAHTKTK